MKERMTLTEFQQKDPLQGNDPIVIQPSFLEQYCQQGDITPDEKQALLEGDVVLIRGFWTVLDRG
jgi:hypothetical protein